MVEHDCRSVVERWVVGDPADREQLAAHLERCAGCRDEVRELTRLLGWLAEDAAIEPSPVVDARIRRRLSLGLAAAQPFRRPLLAAGLALAAFLAVVAALADALARAGATELGPTLAVALGSAYLALSAAAVVPLLLMSKRPLPNGREVQP